MCGNGWCDPTRQELGYLTWSEFCGFCRVQFGLIGCGLGATWLDYCVSLDLYGLCLVGWVVLVWNDGLGFVFVGRVILLDLLMGYGSRFWIIGYSGSMCYLCWICFGWAVLDFKLNGFGVGL